MKGWRFSTVEGNEDCISRRAQGYTKKCLSEELRGLEKALAQVYYIWGNDFEGYNINIDELINTF